MYRPQFVELPTSPAEWWARLHSLVSSWYGVELSDLEVGTAERDRLGRLAGVEVSPAIDQWAAFHAALDAAGLFTRVMRDDYALDWSEELQAITLLIQGEQDLYWGIEATNLGDEDPRVSSWLIDYDTDRWQPFMTWTPTTTNFVLTHVLTYLYGSAAGFSVPVESTTEADDLLGPLVENQVEVYGRVIYEGTDLLGSVGRGPWPGEEQRLALGVELGEQWSRNLPEALRQRLQNGGGMRHGELISDDQRRIGPPGYRTMVWGPTKDRPQVD